MKILKTDLLKIKKTQTEKLLAFYFDSNIQLISKKIFSVDSKTKILIHPQIIFKPAIDLNSCSIILAHNHPSGDFLPSKKDIVFTNKIKRMGKIIGVQLLDHIIITTHDQFSFAENGLL